jgi:hypothetical protein
MNERPFSPRARLVNEGFWGLAVARLPVGLRPVADI